MKKSFIAEYIGRMLPAIILGQMVMTICTTIDAIITTQFLGNNAVAGEGLVTPVTLVIIAVAGIMSAGNATICSNESGKGNVDEMNRVFSTTLTVSLVFSIVCTGPAFCEPDLCRIGACGGNRAFSDDQRLYDRVCPVNADPCRSNNIAGDAAD